MLSASHRVFVWIARLAGIGLVALASLFAFDAFHGKPLAQALPDFAMHLLPAAVVGLVVLAGWRRPWVGAAGFAALGIAYAVSIPWRPEWILAVAGPLFAVSILFVLSAASTPKQLSPAGR